MRTREKKAVGKKALERAAKELTAIAVKHLDTLKPAERTRRIKAFEKTVYAKHPSESCATPRRPAETQEFRLSARGRE